MVLRLIMEYLNHLDQGLPMFNLNIKLSFSFLFNRGGGGGGGELDRT